MQTISASPNCAKKKALRLFFTEFIPEMQNNATNAAAARDKIIIIVRKGFPTTLRSINLALIISSPHLYSVLGSNIHFVRFLDVIYFIKFID